MTISNSDLEALISKEISSAQGDAVLNMRIQGQTTLIDGVLPFALSVIGGLIIPPYGSFLGYLIGSRTYIIEGDVIKYIEK